MKAKNKQLPKLILFKADDEIIDSTNIIKSSLITYTLDGLDLFEDSYNKLTRKLK